MSRKYIKLLRFFLFLFGLGISFNNIGIGGGGRNFTIGFISFFIYLIALIPVLIKRPGIALKRFSIYIVLPLLYFGILSIMNCIYSYAGPTMPIINTTFFFCWILFVCLLVHCCYDGGALPYALYGFAFGTILMGILYLSGAGITLDEEGRLRMFGENSNVLGIICDVGLIIIINDFLLFDVLHLGRLRWLFVLLVIPCVILIFATASRTAFVVLVIVFLSFILQNPVGSGRMRWLRLISGASLLFVCYFYFMRSDSVMLARVLASVEDGNTSGRTEIWKRLIPYVGHHPLFGVGETGYVSVARQALSGMYSSKIHGYSPHNVLLEVTLYTGIFGLIIMLSFWLKLLVKAMRLLVLQNNIKPILLFVPILASVISSQILCIKYAWLIYAYILSVSKYTELKD